jgi:hypothetical protein
MRVSFLVAAAVVLTGCSGARSAPITEPAATVGLPASSPLTSCVDPAPDAPRPLSTALASDFSGDRVDTAFTLDGGRFRAEPPPDDAQPRIGAAFALCNLLATATAQNFAVLEAVAAHGMEFGLGVVSISRSVLTAEPQLYTVGGQQEKLRLNPYGERLAWIAVTTPDIVSSCPEMPTTASPRPAATEPRLPGYQVLVIDAETGADGTIYSARTNNTCGFPGYTTPSVAPIAEFVSSPWSMVSRGPGRKAATIRYAARSCDLDNMGRFLDPGDVGSGPIPAGAGTPAVFADRDQPGLVRVTVQRLLTKCGPPAERSILLRSADLRTDLPQHLVHAPVGAMDTRQPGG